MVSKRLATYFYFGGIDKIEAFVVNYSIINNQNMCYWVGTRKVREVLLKKLQKNPEDEIGQLFYNTFIDPPKPENALQLMEHSVAIGKAEPLLTTLLNSGNALAFKNMNWTLNWSYWDSKTKEKRNGRPLLNSRCENVFWQHKELIFTQRCIIPVDGYWEYYHFKGNTYPYFIYPEHGGLFYLGGIWNVYRDTKTGKETYGFSIITTPPNELTERLHNNPAAHDGPRMLLIIEEQNVLSYLDKSLVKSDIEKLISSPYIASKMKFHSTVRFLKKEFESFIISGRVQEPYNYPELVA